MLYDCLILLILVATAVSQQVGTNTAESHPPLNYQHCTHSGGCQSNSGSVVLDANWRWTHNVGGYTNCYNGNTWDTTLCPDPVTCATNCAIDGADYEGTYGVSSDGTTLTVGFVTVGQYSTNIGSRLYLLASENEYLMFQLKNQEFTFDVDVSNLPCGLNGALYFVQMDADGGMSKYPSNKAGAAYGTGYCDGQCPHDLKFINGQANTIDWTPDPNNKNAGSGFYGTCCNEMDVWEANQFAAAYTPHVCTVNGQYRCNGTECGDSPNNRYNGVCDKDGCDFNSYRMGVDNFLGKGLTVDTSQPFTVVTQWITSDNTSSGDLVEIRRLYVQNGKVIANSATNLPTMKPYDSITDDFCTDQKNLFGDKNAFEANGGLKAMGESLEAGVVLVMSLWDDYTANMLWLDSSYPATANVSQPGITRGPCPTSSGVPSQVESEYPNSAVKYGNIRYGDIGSTYSN